MVTTRLFEKVIRRELRVRPGDLFSKTDLMRSAREIAASGHFNPETMGINPEPNEEDGTVDIVFDLESKANDKVQLSFGWGQTGVTGQVSLSFSNFSIKNLFNPGSLPWHYSAWRRSDILNICPDQCEILSESTASRSLTHGLEANVRTHCR